MQADGFLLDRGHLCYSQIKICWNGDHDKNQFLKNSMNYRGKKQWFTASEIKKSRDSSLVPDPSPQTSSPSNSPLSRGPRGRPEGRRGGACLATVKVSTRGEHTPQLLQAYITFTNTYINTSHTTVGLGGRLPIEAQLTGLKNSRKGHRAPRNVLHVFSPAQEPTLVFFRV